MPPRTLAQGNTTSSPEALRVETNVLTVDRAVNTGEDGSMPGALTPEVATRPISKRDLQIFKKAFNAKMKNKPVRHDQGHVLLLSWAPALDDLKVKPEVSKLCPLYIQNISTKACICLLHVLSSLTASSRSSLVRSPFKLCGSHC